MSTRHTTLRAAAEVTLGRQRSPQHDSGPNMVTYLRAANVKDGVLDLSDVKEMNFTPTEQQIFNLRPGDVLVTEGSGSLKAVGASAVWRGDIAGTVCFQNTLLRLRPRDGRTDGRFLEWWARSTFGSGIFASIATGANIYHISAERVRALPFDLPPLEEQRRIADFLDAETTRIDRMTSTRRTHVELVRERWESVIHCELSRPQASLVEIRRLGAAVTTGPFGTVFNASEYQDGGVPMVNPLHIKNGKIYPDDHHRVAPATATRLSRHQLKAGDLVVGRKGDLGRAALVGEAQDGWVCGSDCIAVHPSTALRPLFLAYVLRSRYVREQLLARSLAATMPSLSEGNLLSLRIPSYTLDVQDDITARLAAESDWHDRSLAAMESQLALLGERRQALITAAVTGQFDVSSASGRNVTDGVPTS